MIAIAEELLVGLTNQRAHEMNGPIAPQPEFTDAIESMQSAIDVLAQQRQLLADDQPLAGL